MEEFLILKICGERIKSLSFNETRKHPHETVSHYSW